MGSLLGTAVGDALGLPYEGVSRGRAQRMLGPPDRYRFVFRRGMTSDDTEHTCLVAQSLIAAGDDVEMFRRQLAWRLRVWLLGLPAGIGLATLKAILKLWLGFPPKRSGVFSAGNGPAMRAAILGAAMDDLPQLAAFVQASTRLTHTDPKAEHGALAVALAARIASRKGTVSGTAYLNSLRTALEGQPAAELLARVERAVASAEAGQETEAFAADLGLSRGVSGYVLHTVPVALQAWLTHQGDFRGGVQAMIRCGGDTDTTASIVGGILGAAVGPDGIPLELRQGLLEWPRSVAWMERLGAELAASRTTKAPSRPPAVPMWAIPPRNLFFLVVVLLHGLRRLLPPF